MAADPPSGLPNVILVGHADAPPYAEAVAEKLRGRATVVGVACGPGLENAIGRGPAPSVVHIDCGSAAGHGAHQRELVSALRQKTSGAVVCASRDDAACGAVGDFGVPLHDMRQLNGETMGDVAAAVADCVMRHHIVKKYSVSPPAKPADPAAGENYRKAEAERDALVPRAYRDFKFGQFKVPSDKGAWTAQREEVLRIVRESLGDLPPRPLPARARLVSREIRAGYDLERVAIDNGDGNDISALVLIPQAATRPLPAILWLHSSTPDKNQIITPNANGGEAPLGEEFVRAGYVVLAPDACLYGDRATNGPSGEREAYRRDAADSFVPAQDRLFKWNMWLGRTLWGMFVRDDQIALDYLCGRPEVDKARVGATGMSMGSTRSWWLAALDERIAATVGVACLTRYQNLIRHGNLRAHGLYYFNYGMLKHFDTEAVLALIAPRPFLALTGDLDYGSPADGIRELEDATARVYAALGATEKFKSILYRDVGHAYTPEMRREMLAWFERWLKPQKATAAEK